MYSLNDDGVAVTHVDAFGDGTPLCGFASDDDEFTIEPSFVTCRDCIAASDDDDVRASGAPFVPWTTDVTPIAGQDETGTRAVPFLGSVFLLVLLFVPVVWLVTMHRSSPVVSPLPREVPFCQQVNAELSVTGAGGQIAPLCGNTPYP